MTTEAKTELSQEAFAEWKARKRKVYDDHVAEVRKRQVSGSENYDKSLLTLASGGLALSLGFLKDFVPIRVADWHWCLYLSWAALTQRLSLALW